MGMISWPHAALYWSTDQSDWYFNVDPSIDYSIFQYWSIIDRSIRPTDRTIDRPIDRYFNIDRLVDRYSNIDRSADRSTDRSDRSTDRSIFQYRPIDRYSSTDRSVDPTDLTDSSISTDRSIPWYSKIDRSDRFDRSDGQTDRSINRSIFHLYRPIGLSIDQPIDIPISIDQPTDPTDWPTDPTDRSVDIPISIGRSDRSDKTIWSTDRSIFQYRPTGQSIDRSSNRYSNIDRSTDRSDWSTDRSYGPTDRYFNINRPSIIICCLTECLALCSGLWINDQTNYS